MRDILFGLQGDFHFFREVYGNGFLWSLVDYSSNQGIFVTVVAVRPRFNPI